MVVVSCSGNTCSVTLGGEGSGAQVLGTRISLEHIRDGQATLRVADEDVSCAEGHSVSAGGLQLRCTSVTTDTVAFTATPG